MTADVGPARAAGAAAALAVAAAWSAFLPLTPKYTVFLAGAAAAAVVLARTHRVPALPGVPGFVPAAALCAWLAVSALWSPAPAAAMVSHLWYAALLLLVPVLVLACPPDAARRGLVHLAFAAATFGALVMLDAVAPLPWRWLRHASVDPEGNQRIVNSVMLALGAALALWHAAHSAGPGRRAAWSAAALLAAAGLALQDRRTGLVLLPLLLVLLVLALQRSWSRRLGLLAVLAIGLAAAWPLADGVRARFAEGAAELRAPLDPATVSTSWGQRRAMFEITAGLVGERPWAGHGLGSWPTLWRAHTPPGSVLAANTTPHNEYLLAAVQGGLPAALLLGWALLAPAVAGWRAGSAAGGPPVLLVWSCLATAGLFNAVLRDAKLALPLLIAAALAGAAMPRPSAKLAAPR